MIETSQINALPYTLLASFARAEAPEDNHIMIHDCDKQIIKILYLYKEINIR